jgi:peptidoglycan/LPS O-acetylase OafA/YrhL
MSEQETPVSRMHLGYVDGLRALAALYVVGHHCWYSALTPERKGFPPSGVWALTGWLFYGHFSVSAFIVISGFSLMLPVVRAGGTLRGGALTFFKRRAKRILPPYYFALALSLVLIWRLIGQKTGTHWDLTIPVTPEAIVTHLLLIHNFDVASVYKINGVLWSIAVEWQIYFLFPPLVLLARRFSIGATTLLTVAAAYLAFFGLRRTPIGALPTYGNTGIMPQYVALFALGMLGAALAFAPGHRYAALRRFVPWAMLAFVLLAAVAICCALIGEQYFQVWQIGGLDLLVGLATLALLVAAGLPGRNPINAVLGWGPLAFVGTFSYSLYLIHMPLVQIVQQYALDPLHLDDLTTLGLLLLCVPLIVGVAYLFSLVCERPFLNSRTDAAQAHAGRRVSSQARLPILVRYGPPGLAPGAGMDDELA